MDYRVIQTSQTYFFVKSLIPLTQHLWDSPPRFPRDHRSEINVTAQWALSLECLCTSLLRVVSWKIIMSAVFCLCYYDVISPPTKGRTDIPFRSRADWKKKIIFYLDQIIYLSGVLHAKKFKRDIWKITTFGMLRSSCRARHTVRSASSPVDRVIAKNVIIN